MYREQHNSQLSIEEFHLPFGGTLDPENRWVLLSALMPWEELEETYAPQFSPVVGPPAKPMGLEFGGLFIKQRLGLTDVETVHQIRENAYMQFFLGFGTLSIDASCMPADITYPTDLKLLNEVREATERIIDDLCRQSAVVGVHRPRYDRGKARAHLLNVARQKKPRRRKLKGAVRRQLSDLQRNLETIDALIAAGASLSAFRPHWWQKLLACSELHRQQSILINSKTRSIPDRLGNLVPGQVRPIVRGKARAAVEFGAKISASVQNGFPYLHLISWNAYNEGNNLIAQAEKYKQDTGCYPERICADRIYINTKNRHHCTVMCAEKILRLVRLFFVHIVAWFYCLLRL